MTQEPTAACAEIPAALLEPESLPSIPAVAMEVLRVTDDPESSLEDLACAIEIDPALSLKLVKLANSPLIGSRNEITTLRHAATVLGMKTCKMMSLGFSLVGAMPRSQQTNGFSYDGYWRRSIIAAVAARACAKRSRGADADEAFLCGLIGFIGRLIVSTRMPEKYGDVLRASPGWPSAVIEQGVLGFDSAMIAGAICTAWRFPPRLGAALDTARRASNGEGWADLLESTDPDVALARAVLVGQLAQEVLGDAETGAALVELQAVAAAAMGASREDVDLFLIDIEACVESMSSLFEVRTGAVPHAELVDQARSKVLQTGLEAMLELNTSQRKLEELLDENSDLEQRARTDALTGLPNRAAFDEYLERQVHWRLRHGEALSLGVIMIDVDHFKNVNDMHGHQSGDMVLVEVAKKLGTGLRRGDLSARYGGEEFVVLLPSVNEEGIAIVAERLRQEVAALEFNVGGTLLKVTASFGAALCDRVSDGADGAALTRIADEALYTAKRTGRNRCVITIVGARGGLDAPIS